MAHLPTTYSPDPIQPLHCGPTTGNVARTASFGRSGLVPDAHIERAMRAWGAGDYDRISMGFRHEAQAFIERLSLTRHDRVLDAACGSGNLAIPAARSGARVIACDIVPRLLDAAAEWGARERLVIGLDQAAVEALPYGDARFDVVVSMFGTMFSVRPDCVVAELARVTRSGGRVALANWTRDSFAGRVLEAHAAYVPLPHGVPSPLLWGDEAIVHRRFDRRLWDVTTTTRTLTLRYPHSPAGTAELFRAAFGPTIRTFEVLDEDRRALLAAELREQWRAAQRPGARFTEVDSDYVEVIAVRR